MGPTKSTKAFIFIHRDEVVFPSSDICNIIQVENILIMDSQLGPLEEIETRIRKKRKIPQKKDFLYFHFFLEIHQFPFPFHILWKVSHSYVNIVGRSLHWFQPQLSIRETKLSFVIYFHSRLGWEDKERESVVLMRDTAQGGDIQDTHSHHKSSVCQDEAGALEVERDQI